MKYRQLLIIGIFLIMVVTACTQQGGTNQNTGGGPKDKTVITTVLPNDGEAVVNDATSGILDENDDVEIGELV